MTIWLGANDAALAPSVQHVPLETYRSNLLEMIDLIRAATPHTRLLLLTPPPLSPDKWRSQNLDKPVDGGQECGRTVQVTETYAQAVRDVAGARSVTLVDIWETMTARAELDGDLDSFLLDGLHLTQKGYDVVSDGKCTAPLHLCLSRLGVPARTEGLYEMCRRGSACDSHHLARVVLGRDAP